MMVVSKKAFAHMCEDEKELGKPSGAENTGVADVSDSSLLGTSVA